MNTLKHVCFVIALNCLTIRVGIASTELHATYDARSVALGGTGVAYSANATAILHNPALLDGIDTFSASLALSPFSTTFSGPITAPKSEMDSKASFSPLIFGGAALRVHDRVVVGLGAYPTAGFGARYENIDALGGMDMESSLSMLEIAVPVSFKIMDGLSIGLGLRATYLKQTTEAPVVAMDPATGQPVINPTTSMPVLLETKQELSGWNFLGIQAGVFYQALPNLRLGFSYRSKITVSADGTTTIGEDEYDTTSDFSAPHAFRLGAALSLLENKLLVTSDVKYLMYKNANEKLIATLDTPLGDLEQETPLLWRDTISAHFGSEYQVHEMVAARLGYAVSRTVTPNRTASAFLAPPGLMHSIHTGAGIILKEWDVDLAAYYAFGGEDVKNSTATNMGEGRYGLTAYMIAVSGTYHF